MVQLKSFFESTFPKKRKIRRSLRQRLKSYIIHRLTEALQRNKDIGLLIKNFHRIYSRRNEIGHSLELYTKAPGLVEDVNVLMSCLKQIFDYELKSFIDGDFDWKFEKRPIDLRENSIPKTQERILDYFYFSIEDESQKNTFLITTSMTKELEKVKFESKILSDGRFLYQKYMKIYFFPDFKETSVFPTSKDIFTLQENPYWWIITEIDDTKYIFKLLPPNIINTKYKKDGKKQVSTKIPSKDILLVMKLYQMDKDDDIFIQTL
jgi:hypothetical protein